MTSISNSNRRDNDRQPSQQTDDIERPPRISSQYNDPFISDNNTTIGKKPTKSKSPSIPKWLMVMGGGVAAVLLAIVIFKLVQWMWGTAERGRTTADPLSTTAAPVAGYQAPVPTINETTKEIPTIIPIDRAALVHAWLESKNDQRSLATHWREDMAAATAAQQQQTAQLHFKGLSKAAMATNSNAGSKPDDKDKPVDGGTGDVNKIKQDLVPVTVTPAAATAPFGATSNNQIRAEIGGDDARLRRQIRAGQSEDETAFINGMCPLPYQLKMLGNPTQVDTASAAIHCYVPCPDGFEEVMIAPYADDRENPGNAQKGMYWACLAVCPDNVEETDSRRGCKAQMKVRARGTGWQHVKIPLYNMGPEIIAAHKDRVLPSYPASVQIVPNDADNKKRWKSPEFRALVTGNFDYARTDTWAAVVGGEDLGRSVWFQDKGGYNWSFRINDTSTTEHTYERYLMPTGCGEDYDLSFDKPVPYFDFFQRFGSMRDTMSWGVEQYQHCYQSCPAFSPAIPSGLMESLRCLEQCPANTRRHPTEPNQCIKDGFKQEIKFADVLQLVDSVFHSTVALPSAIDAWKREQEAEKRKHTPPPPTSSPGVETSPPPPPPNNKPGGPAVEEPTKPVAPSNPPVAPVPTKPHTQVPPPRLNPPPPPPGMPEV